MDKKDFKAAKQAQRLAEYNYTDSCTICGKGLWDRDSEYSNYMFGSSYCASHAPKTNKWNKEFLLKR